MLEFDVETTGLQPWSGKQYAFLFLFFDGVNPPEAIPYDPSHPDDEQADNWRRIQEWFDKAKADPEGIRAWNSNFDRSFADAAGFDVPGDGHWHDGMIEAHAIDERRSVALKAVAVQLFGEDADDLQKEVKSYLTKERARRKKAATEAGEELIEPNFSDVPMEIMEPYGKEDVILTRKVCDNYAPMIENSSWLRDIIDFERKVMDALYHVQKRGIPASIDDYRKLELEVVENLEGLEQRAIDLAIEGGAPEDFNPRSPQQILAALKSRGADLTFVTDEKMDAENLVHVDDPLAEAILKFRSEFKVLSTYVRPMIGRTHVSAMRMWKEPFIAADGRIHASYRQLGARTGRMSCSDPNMQNQPRDDLRLRYNIVADPGYVFVTCDLSNIEMRLFAAYAGDGALRDAVRAGKDLHTMTAEFIGIRDRARAGGAIETARQRGKTFNFSIIYGGGIRTIRKQQRCSQDEARLMKRRYYDAYPEVDRLQRRIEYRLSDDGYITSLWGRRMRVDVRDAFKAVNYLVQGSAADLLKQALIDLHAQSVPVVALIHDEIMAHVPIEQAEETQATIIEALTAAANPGGKLWDPVSESPVVPLEADGAIVKRWSDAKPLKDEDGKPYLFTPQWAGGEKRYV